MIMVQPCKYNKWWWWLNTKKHIHAEYTYIWPIPISNQVDNIGSMGVEIPSTKLWWRKRLVVTGPGWSEFAVISAPSSCSTKTIKYLSIYLVRVKFIWEVLASCKSTCVLNVILTTKLKLTLVKFLCVEGINGQSIYCKNDSFISFFDFFFCGNTINPIAS